MLAARFRRIFLIAGAALALACAAEPERLEPAYLLVERFGQARTSAEIAEIDMASPEAAARLGAGWSYRERDRERGRHFRWGIGSHSEVTLFEVEPRDVTLVVEGRPLAASAEQPQPVAVRVNGHELGGFAMGAELAEYRVALSADALVQGANRVALAYGPNPLADQAGSARDSRGLAVAWYRIAFEGQHDPIGEPVADAESELLFLPYGTQVDYFLLLPPDGLLRADRWGFRGTAAGRLEIHIESDSVPARELAKLKRPSALDVPLELEPYEPVCVSLRASALEPVGAEGGVLLSKPAIWSSAPSTEPPLASEPAPTPPRPNIIVYLVDTLRSDHLGCYGYPRPVSPRLDAFAETATLFENARAQSSWTLASVASIFTGLWPHAHGVTRNPHRLGNDALTLAEILQAAGYQTSGVVTNGYVTEAFGLEQGFDELLLIHTESAQAVNREMVAWLERRDPSRPFFLYLHTLEPHIPYLPPDGFRERFAPDSDEVYDIIREFRRKTKWDATESILGQLFDLYDAEIAANDTAFGDALDHLAQAGLLDDSIVVFVSDHGEAFHEHGTWAHGSNLFAEVLNVPLVVKMPAQRAGRRVAEPVQHIDLLPTLLHYLELEGPVLQGRSLLPLLDGGGSAGRRALFSQTSRFSPDTMSVIEGDWKYIERRDPKRGVSKFLYDWRRDPGELASRIAERPILAAVLRAAIEYKLAAGQIYETEESVIDEELREGLRALGYLN